MRANFSIIFAAALNRVIGSKGQMPWHIPGELARFKQITMGHTLVMGRKTFESIGKPLPGRTNLILSRQDVQFPGCVVIKSLDEAHLYSRNQSEIFVIGGAEIYSLALPLANKLYRTLLLQNFPGDTYMPEYDENLFCIRFHERIQANVNYDFTVFVKRNQFNS